MVILLRHTHVDMREGIGHDLNISNIVLEPSIAMGDFFVLQPNGQISMSSARSEWVTSRTSTSIRVRACHRRPLRRRRSTTAQGQTEKNSVRAYVFCFTLSTGHCSAQSALRIWASSGTLVLVEEPEFRIDSLRETVSSPLPRPLPRLAAPGKTLRERVDLVVVPARKREQLGNKLVQPRRFLRQEYGPAFEQIDLRNEAFEFVSFGLVVDHVHVLLAESLDQTVANAAFLDDQRSDTVSLLHFDNLLLQSVERKSASNNVEHEVQIATIEQDDAG